MGPYDCANVSNISVPQSSVKWGWWYESCGAGRKSSKVSMCASKVTWSKQQARGHAKERPGWGWRQGSRPLSLCVGPGMGRPELIWPSELMGKHSWWDRRTEYAWFNNSLACFVTLKCLGVETNAMGASTWPFPLDSISVHGGPGEGRSTFGFFPVILQSPTNVVSLPNLRIRAPCDPEQSRGGWEGNPSSNRLLIQVAHSSLDYSSKVVCIKDSENEPEKRGNSVSFILNL